MGNPEDNSLDFGTTGNEQNFDDWIAGKVRPDWPPRADALRALAGRAIPGIEFPVGGTVADRSLEQVKRTADHTERQTGLLDAMNALSAEQAQTLAALSKASGEQVQTLAAMRKLSEELASEQRRSAAREDIQQGFNRRMSWAALLLAGAAVVVPFGILLIEQALR